MLLKNWLVFAFFLLALACVCFFLLVMLILKEFQEMQMFLHSSLLEIPCSIPETTTISGLLPNAISFRMVETLLVEKPLEDLEMDEFSQILLVYTLTLTFLIFFTIS